MKKFFEKHDLIKIAGIMVLISAILTWVIPYGYYSGTEMIINEISRISITNFLQYGMLGMYYFTVLITFLFVLGGFYQVLSKSNGYQNLVKAISRVFKTRQTLFVLIVSFVIAALTSISTEYFPIIVFIPFIITILSKIKVDKITAFTTTFGSMLVGILGSTYNTNIASVLNGAFRTSVGTAIGYKIALFVTAYALLNIFSVCRIRKNKHNKNQEEYDRFEVETPKTVRPDIKNWPCATILIILGLVTILAYLPWTTWEVSMWDNVTKTISEWELFGVPIIKYFFDPVLAFGKWDIFTIQFILIFATLVIKWVEHISFDEVISSFGSGFKKMAPVVLMLLLVYFVLEISVMFPTVPYLADAIANWSDGFNVAWSSLSALIASIFSVEMRYVVSLAGTYYATEFAQHAKTLAIIYQTVFGIVGFVVPTSAILMIGLSYLRISYIDWIKNIWKFLVGMLAVIVTIIALVALEVSTKTVLFGLLAVIILCVVALIIIKRKFIVAKIEKMKKTTK